MGAATCNFVEACAEFCCNGVNVSGKDSKTKANDARSMHELCAALGNRRRRRGELTFFVELALGRLFFAKFVRREPPTLA